MAAPRVVSLVPSATETLLAWGIEPVACTRFCEQPALRHVGGTKDPDLTAIVGLLPDLVVVCDEENRREDADELVRLGVRIHSCSPRAVAEVERALADLAAALDVVPPADAAGGPLPTLPPVGLRAFVPIWRRPWMTLAGDTFGSSLLEAVGVVNVFADATDRYPEVSLDEARQRQPDVVLAPSEPYTFRPVHLEALAEVAPVVEVDGQDLFWWGARTPAAIHRLHRHLSHLTPR